MITQKQKKVVLTLPEKLKVVDLLRKHTKKIGTGLCAYEEGWTDERIAQEAGPRIKALNHVRQIRQQTVGKLLNKRQQPRTDKVPGPAANSQLLARLVFLEARVSRLYAELGVD